MESVAKVASAASTGPVRGVSPFGEGSLSVGQFVHARVTRVEGDTVQLRWGGHAMSVASRVPLEVGQEVSLQVEDGGAGKMLLRMVDETFGKGRPPGQGGGSGRAGGGLGPDGAPRGPAASAPGWGGHTADISADDLAFWGAGAGAGGRATGSPAAPRPGSVPGTTNNPSAQAAMDGDPLAALLSDPLNPSTTRTAAADLMRQSAAGAGGHVARSALPTYGRLAQSVGGTAAFGQLLTTIGRDAGQTLLRAPLSPSDVGRLLVEIGLRPDEMSTTLVSEMLTQGTAVNEASVRQLRRDLTAAGGSLRDAAATVALGRLGLPVTPLSLAIARQLLSGQLDPKAAWGELLGELQGLARGVAGGSQAGVLAAELLADWRLPLEQGADGLARWLRTAMDQAATPLEAKLARMFAEPGGQSGQVTTPGQDVRARLDLLAQALPPSGQGERAAISHALQRSQATIQAEQFLNGATSERTEPKFFAVTLPTVMGQQSSTLELRVREREAQPRTSGDVAQPDIVQMRLSLPGLGDLGVNLMVGQHSVSCHFSAGSAFAEAMLSASASELIGRLKRLGFAHTSVDAAHERIEPSAAPLTQASRINRVDLKA